MAQSYKFLRDSFLPPGWLCLVLGGIDESELSNTAIRGSSSSSTSNNSSKSSGGGNDGDANGPYQSRFFVARKGAYPPDILGAADVMIGKIGYGTVSECLAHLCPLLYIPRVDWPEQSRLETLLEDGAGM